MKSLKVIQLGDVHFPDHKDSCLGDLKDAAAPPALVKAITPNRLQLVMRKVAQVAVELDACGLLICGDLTTRGDLAGYESCVEYLHKAVEIGNTVRWNANALHVVPGNHDVDRKLCDPDGKDLLAKFDPLVASWDKLGRSAILPIANVRSSTIRPNGHALALFSLNSCIGSQETRRIPADICEQVLHTLSPHFRSTPPANILTKLGERIDTPAFDHEHVRSLVSSINSLEATAMPIVLAHHNALSQSTPRVALYTELLNAGLFRAQLASCARPVVYCHGHIHADPIEQLTDHRYPKSKILFVSAPEIVDGFNVIEIKFARNDLPVGCLVHQYRVSVHGSVDVAAPISIPLMGADMVSRFDDEKFRALLKVCDSELRRFEEIRKGLAKELKSNPQSETVRDLIEEAEWLALLQVHDRQQPHKHWKIRRVEP